MIFRIDQQSVTKVLSKWLIIWISVDAEIKPCIVKLYMNGLQSIVRNSAFLLLKCMSQAFVQSGFLFPSCSSCIS